MDDGDEAWLAEAAAAADRAERVHRYHQLLIVGGSLACVLRSGFVNDKTLLVAAAACSEWRAAIAHPDNVKPGVAHIVARRRTAPPFFVDIAIGNDTAAGTQAAPLATVERASLMLSRCPFDLKHDFQEHPCAASYNTEEPPVAIMVRCDAATCPVVRCSLL